MSRVPPRWLQLAPVAVMFLTAAITGLVPRRHARHDRITGAIICTGAALMLAALLLTIASQYASLIGGLT